MPRFSRPAHPLISQKSCVVLKNFRNFAADFRDKGSDDNQQNTTTKILTVNSGKEIKAPNPRF